MTLGRAAKRAGITLVVSASLAACSKAPPTIEAGGVGDVRIGVSAEALEEAYPPERRQRVDLRLEGMPAPAFELMPEGTTRPDALVAELIEQDGTLRVFRIRIRDAALETEHGVGVGDTVGDLRASYALGRLIGGEGNLGIRVPALSATFLLDRERVQPGWWQTHDPSLVPDDVEIREIFLTAPLEPSGP
ncbi:MAG TPA: hypothetical protein VF329_11700 [Gammaproteobacteria bacterium]